MNECRLACGTELIAAERKRQIAEEGWSEAHDDGHTDGALAVVAATLAVDGTDAKVVDPLGRGTPGAFDQWGCQQDGDGWGLLRKHKDDEIRKLVIAGALIAAEIDRIQRQAVPQQEQPMQPSDTYADILYDNEATIEEEIRRYSNGGWMLCSRQRPSEGVLVEVAGVKEPVSLVDRVGRFAWISASGDSYMCQIRFGKLTDYWRPLPKPAAVETECTAPEQPAEEGALEEKIIQDLERDYSQQCVPDLRVAPLLKAYRRLQAEMHGIAWSQEKLRQADQRALRLNAELAELRANLAEREAECKEHREFRALLAQALHKGLGD